MSLNAQVRGARAPKPPIDVSHPVDTLFETEPRAGAGKEPTLTIFLAGAECSYTCVFCDLWKHTTDEATPPGAIPSQIGQGLGSIPAGVDPQELRVKLYNASNFFDARSVPVEDDEQILKLLAPYHAVTVENHPRLTNDRCLAFATALAGRLEVAMGLETIAPETLKRLNKRSGVEDFDRAADTLVSNNIDVRAFVLLAPPFQPREEAVEWAVRSAEYAFARGARFVAINPVRSGNGFMDNLEASGDWSPPSLAQVEAALLGALRLGEGAVVADLWEIERFTSCAECDERRLDNLRWMNESQQPSTLKRCGACER